MCTIGTLVKCRLASCIPACANAQSNQNAAAADPPSWVQLAGKLVAPRHGAELLPYVLRKLTAAFNKQKALAPSTAPWLSLGLLTNTGIKQGWSLTRPENEPDLPGI